MGDPYRLWSRTYLPVDRPGFGVPAAPEPLRDLPPDMRALRATYTEIHAQHRSEALPRIVASRAARIGHDAWGGWRAPLFVFFLIGLVAIPREGFFALATAVVLFLSHLAYAHDPRWSVYYVEAAPALAVITATGVWAALNAPLRWGSTGPTGAGTHPAPALAAIALALFALWNGTADMGAARLQIERWSVYHDHFQDRIAAIPEPRAIVFVRYEPHHLPDMSLIRNSPDPTRAPVWIVYDRGQDNARLLREAPERAAYLYDAAVGTLVPWSPGLAAGTGSPP